MSLRVQVELVKQFQNADIAGAINDDAQRAIAAVLAAQGEPAKSGSSGSWRYKTVLTISVCSIN